MTDSKKPEDTNRPKPGGFGAFADKYRDRWAASHPSSKKPDDAAAANTGDGPGEGAPAPEPRQQSEEERQPGGKSGPGRGT